MNPADQIGPLFLFYFGPAIIAEYSQSFLLRVSFPPTLLGATKFKRHSHKTTKEQNRSAVLLLIN